MSASLGGVSASAMKAGSSGVVGQDRSQRREQALVGLGIPAGAQPRDVAGQKRRGERLHRLPAVERIAVTGRQQPQVVRRKIGAEPDRRGEAAVDRQSGRRLDVAEHDRVGGLVEHDHAALDGPAVGRRKRQVAAVRRDQAGHERDRHRLLDGLAGRRLQRLREIERVGSRRRVVATARDHLRRAGLRIPAHELREVAAARLGEAGHELLDGRGLAVVAREVEVHALTEALRSKQRLEHANDLGAFLVDRRGVEVVDLPIGVRPHRVGEGPRILDELVRAQDAHVADPRDHARAFVGGELLIAEDGEALLQAELEPVAAGDAVAGPVVEILVGDDRLDIGEVGVGRGFRRGEDVLVVEDVQPLVLHRAHVEVGHGDDHEDVEIVFAAERLLVPAHGTLQRIHRVAGAVLLAGLHVNSQRDLAAGQGDEAVLDVAELPADQREQIRGLRPGIVPDREVAAVAEIAAVGQVAVGEQHWRVCLVGLDPRRIDRHHVGPVREIGDAAKAFGLALRAPCAAGAIEAGQLGVGGRIDQRFDFEREGSARRLRDREPLRRRGVLIRGQVPAVEPERHQREPVSVERQRRGRAGRRIGLEAHGCAHRRPRRVQRHVEMHGLDQPFRRTIFGEANGTGLFGAHHGFRILVNSGDLCPDRGPVSSFGGVLLEREDVAR